MLTFFFPLYSCIPTERSIDGKTHETVERNRNRKAYSAVERNTGGKADGVLKKIEPASRKLTG